MDTNNTELKPLHMHVECMEAWLFANEWTFFSDWSILLPIILTSVWTRLRRGCQSRDARATAGAKLGTGLGAAAAKLRIKHTFHGKPCANSGL